MEEESDDDKNKDKKHWLKQLYPGMGRPLPADLVGETFWAGIVAQCKFFLSDLKASRLEKEAHDKAHQVM